MSTKKATRRKKPKSETLDRAHVKTLPDHERHRLQAEALALLVKLEDGKATDTERERLRDLICCGMLPGDPPPVERITAERNTELRDRARRIIEGKPVSVFLNSEAEAVKVREHLAALSAATLEAARVALAAKNRELTAGHVALSEALSAWVLRILKDTATTLTEDEARLFAAMITRTGTTEDGAPKYMTQREIGRVLGVSAMAVKRREDNLRRDHKKLADWLEDNGITRKPRGTRKRTVTKRKKSA